MRIAVGGIEHESSSLLPDETPLATFLKPEWYFDSADLAESRGETNTVVDGYIRALRQHPVEIVPLILTHGGAGGQVSLETHATLCERLLEPLRAAMPVDGILLSLHGGYSVQGIDDGDGDVLRRVRQLVGPDLPIMVVHDMHCNVSQQTIDHATALTVMRTYPHTDMAERAVEAVELMIRTLRGEVNPKLAFRPLPLFWSAAHMITAEQPMSGAIQQIEQLQQQPGVLMASIGVGYQWVDLPCTGASAIVVTDGDAEDAQAKSDELARWLWQRRADWQRPGLAPADGLDQGEAIGKYPIILADQGDNPGGGSPGDSTEILQLFIDRNLQDAAVLHIVDPETVQQARGVGVGNTVDVRVGGKSHPRCGPPVAMTAEVLAVTDGRFVYDGPMWEKRPGYHGDSVLLRYRGIYIAVISLTEQAIDLAFSRTLGLDCRKQHYICVKSTGHFRSGFEPIAGSIFNVDAAALLPQDFSQLPFQRLGRKVYPMDEDAEPGF